MLSHLDLGDCHVGTEGARAVAAFLEKSTRLENLILSGNADMGADGIAAIAHALKENTSLRALSLDYCKLCVDGDQKAALKALCEGLETNKTLRELDLEGNQIDDEGARMLLEVLEKSNKGGLREMEVAQGNVISEANLQRISQVLSTAR